MSDLRALDAEIARVVFGAVCLHEMEGVPTAVLVADNRKSFVEEYGEEPPATWTGETWDDGDYPAKWCRLCHTRSQDLKGWTLKGVPAFSTDITAAWRVVDKMVEYKGGIGFEITRWVDGWAAQFGSKNYPDDIWGEGASTSAPEAICNAAVAALTSTNSKKEEPHNVRP